MTWFIYSLLGAILMTAYGLSIRLLLKDRGDARTFTFITTFFGGISVLFLLPFEKLTLVFDPRMLIIPVLLAGSYALTDFSFISGRQLEEVSVVSILVQLGNFWALLGGSIIFKEVLTLNKLAGVSLIVLGSVILVWQKTRIILSKGKYYILLGTLLFTINSLVDKSLSRYFSASLYKGVLLLLEALVLFTFFLPQKFKAISAEFKIQGKKIILVGPLLSLSLFFLMRAFQVGGEASQVLPVFSLSLAFSVLAGILFLKERNHLAKKLIAMTLVLLGTYLIQLGG